MNGPARSRWGAFIGASLVLGVLPACSKSEPAEVVSPATPDQIYTVRGQIEQLPQPGRPAFELMIHHEPIDNFVGRDGSIGMPEMTMPFPPAKSLSLTGLAVGDKIEFVFEVRWTGTPTMRVTRISTLPAGTELHFAK